MKLFIRLFFMRNLVQLLSIYPGQDLYAQYLKQVDKDVKTNVDAQKRFEMIVDLNLGFEILPKKLKDDDAAPGRTRNFRVNKPDYTKMDEHKQKIVIFLHETSIFIR